MPEESCIFCKIIKNEIPSFVLFENDDFKVILDRFPAALGHAVILAKGHYENIFELPESKAATLFPLVKKIATVLHSVFDCDGINILQNNGAEAGQTVMHFHIHVIPRFEEDNISIAWSQLALSEDEFENIRAKITESLHE